MNIDSSATISLTEDNGNSRQTIAVIGGGPGAMFFCHAIESKRNELMKMGKDVSRYPIVRCFERSPGPGGVWRNDRQHEETHDGYSDNTDAEDPSLLEEKKEDDSLSDGRKMKKLKIDEDSQFSTQDESSSKDITPNMYSALWTNGPKEGFEFADYTFLDHFGDVSMPTFLPRKYVLDYILARCTSKCPNFFEKYFSFRTSVLNVRYLEHKENETVSEHSTDYKFRVHTRNEITGVEEFNIFDKCIWAGGVNGIPYTPTKMLNLFKDGGFTGSLVHSSNTTNFKEEVENKRVLIVGGGLSAEDLSLMAIKEGVTRLYCTYRGSDEKEMSWTSRWPYDKVEVLPRTTIVNVEGSTITLEECYRDHIEWKYRLYKNKKGKKSVLNDIDTVIFCTGYDSNLNMLDPLLREAVEDDDEDDDDDSVGGLKMPRGWKMDKDKEMEILLGKDRVHVKPSKVVYPSDDFENYYEDLYRGCILIENPNMMYMIRDFSHVPLLETDITAWMLASFVTGGKALPSSKEMLEEMNQITLKCMENVFLRYKMDAKFTKIISRAFPDDEFNREQNELWEAAEKEADDYHFILLGRMMEDGSYPFSFLSEDGKSLSEIGKKIGHLVDHGTREEMHKVKYGAIEDGPFTFVGKDKQHILRPGWMTFRDAADAEKFESLFTGMKSCRLPKPWFELDESDKLW